ncbi:hypothetical protein TCAL_10137 [Tigriopus californicus]|uniref:Band 7 domain-containing protein n=1 Tax=Tigriopus californicus TaxID=6832 RepID=A0A553PFJ1_TIGCA|nr:hypothetical protein TCAL_10137 [Tigriopus californicus]|eukprot:TCALIF_10137-PA protein Name:"Similar to STOM Erythrocyte band 7 integral membrane protein (Homo sapiens)" AED:0.22 eAED:0.22 QI:0/0/0/0.66/1/1/3/0/285
MSTKSADSIAIEEGRVPAAIEPGRGYQVGSGDNEEGGCSKCLSTLLLVVSIILVIVTLPISIFMVVKQVQKGGSVGPGLFFIIPCVDSISVVDLRTVSFDVPPQEILTKDSVTVAVDAVVYYKIQNPMASVCNVENASVSTKLLASTTLRNILGMKNLSEVLSDREHTAAEILRQLDVATDPWGIKVERVEVKDVRLPQQLQRAMAAEAEASREARAKVIAAEGEQKASRALKEASDIMSESPAALQLRYLQTLSQISAEKNSTIIFPLPMEMMNQFANQSSHSR